MFFFGFFFARCHWTLAAHSQTHRNPGSVRTAPAWVIDTNITRPRSRVTLSLPISDREKKKKSPALTQNRSAGATRTDSDSRPPPCFFPEKKKRADKLRPCGVPPRSVPRAFQSPINTSAPTANGCNPLPWQHISLPAASVMLILPLEEKKKRRRLRRRRRRRKKMKMMKKKKKV